MSLGDNMKYEFINNINYGAKNYDYAVYIDKLLEKRKQEIFDFFGTNQNIKFNIFLYNTVEDLRQGLLDRGFGFQPEYMCACHKDMDNSLNYFEPADEYSETDWCKAEYDDVIFHEAVHGTEYTIYGTHPEWLTEGIAGMLAGQYKKGKRHLLDNYVNKYKLPDISALKDETFVTDDYDGYDLSYLMVSYLIESYGKEEFLNIIKDNNKIKEHSNDLVNKAVNYYNANA